MKLAPRRLLTALPIVFLLTMSASGHAGIDSAQGSQLKSGGQTHTSCNAVVLSLQPGVLGVNGHRDPAYPNPPRNMPVDPVAAEGPLYPGATSTHESVSRAARGPLVSEVYVKTAVGEYVVAAPHSKVFAWYTHAFLACGYDLKWQHPYGQGYADSGYESPTTPALYISLAVVGIPGNRTLAVYYAQVISPPARTQAYLLPAGEVSARIEYSPKPSVTYQITIRDSDSLGILVATINAGSTMDILQHSCFEPRGTAQLVFKRRNGASTKVTVLPFCEDFTFGNRPIPVADRDLAVWYAVGMVVYRYCASHSCK